MKNFCKRAVSLVLTLCLALPIGSMVLPAKAVSFEPVDGKIVVDEAIDTYEYEMAISGSYKGTDYLYLLYKGSTMLVYNMDENGGALEKCITTSDDAYTHSTPFGACFDGEGNLWVCGAGTYLYKYNPATQEGTQYSFSNASFGGASTNAYGITYAAETGKLYFSYNGYLAQCDPKTGVITVLSSQLYDNSFYLGYGGIVYDGGCLYAGVNDTYDQIIKYDISKKTCTTVYTAFSNSGTSYGIPYLSYVDGMLIGGYTTDAPETCVISISSSVPSALNGIHVVGRVSGAIGSKVYFKNGNNLCAYDTGTKSLTDLGKCDVSLQCINGVVTMGSNTSILAPKNNTSTLTLDLVVYTPSGNRVSTSTISQFTGDDGTSMMLRALIADPTGRYLYAGAYGINKIAVYDLETKQTKIIPGYGHQTDSLFWYNNKLYVGNYSSGAITQIDPETGDLTHFFDLMETDFKQKRMFALTAGDDKVFCGTVPDTERVGGALVWYDLDTGYTYVAVGPDTDDVYYAKVIVDSDTALDNSYTWYNASTGRAASLPSAPTGVIENQCINTIVYKDGYIYGTTTKANGQDVPMNAFDGNALIFVYDVANQKVIGTCDVSETLSNVKDADPAFPGFVSWIDAFAADPYEEGKFWGVVSDTLFSVDISISNGEAAFAVHEAIGQSVEADYKHSSSYWSARNIVFDGDYLYVSFGNKGTYMVNTQNPTENYKLSDTVISEMALGADGNLYYFTNIPRGNYDQHDIMCFPVSGSTQPLVAASVQTVIDALDVKNPDKAAINAARTMYDDLTETAKALVNTENLEAAEKSSRSVLITSADGTTTTYYDDIVKALENAVSGDRVQLLKDVTTEANLTVKAGVTLDLNGCKLTVTDLLGFSGSHVIDRSADAAGVLTVTNVLDLPTDNRQFPLYDSAKGGYRFFTGSMVALGTREGTNDNVQFGFRLEFENADAYELIAGGEAKMDLTGVLTVGNIKVDTSFGSATVQKYGNMEVESHSASGANVGRTASMYLNVTSISAAKGAKITYAPTMSCAGVEMTVTDIDKLTLKATLSWEFGTDFWTIE